MARIIIIGGLSAGPSAAAKARRENEEAEIMLFEKTANISYATCGIPYALSGHIKTRDNLLVVDAQLLRDRFNIDVHLNEAVTSIDPEAQTVTTAAGTYAYDKLVFATGAKTFVPKVENLESARNWATCRSLEDFDHIVKEGLTDDVQHITVMGAGLIGIEVAENLRHAGKSVTVIEGAPQILPMWQPKFSAFAQNILEENGIEIIKSTFVNRVEVSGDRITHIDLGGGKMLETDFVIMSVGIKPNTELLTSKGAKAIPNGALIVNEHFETSLPNIYAAGDNVSITNLITGQPDYLPLGTHSNKGGRAAGNNAAGGNEILRGGYKTAIIQVFDHTLARTGLGPRDLEKAGMPFSKSLIVANATPGYYPHPTDLIVETYYHPVTLTLLGAEIFGQVGVDKRIDVLSTAIYAKLKMTDLPQLDLAYAPPYSPAKDPVVVNGYAATNAVFNGYREMSVEDLREQLVAGADLQIVDVRHFDERDHLGKVPTSQWFELEHLREHLAELDPNKKTVLYCAKGLRGYVGYKILQHAGFKDIYNLAGGFKVWHGYERQFPAAALEVLHAEAG